MSIKSRKTWLAAGFTALLAGGAPGFVVPSMMNVAMAQTQKISGTVVDEFGDPIIGANIRVVGTTTGAVTDIDGKFSVDAKSGTNLEVSFIGYATQIVKASAGMTVTLREDAQSLDDVVVVGYGVQKKKLVTGATVQVKGDDIAKLNTSNALTGMQATTPGVQITQSSSQPGKGFKVNIRGVGTINGASPLLVIDGVPCGTADNGLNGLNPNEIESIDVLKDAASCAIYGSNGANGVILVTTKQGKAGKVTTTYDGFIGWSNPYKRPSTLNAQDYMKVVNETNYNMTGEFVNWSSLVPQSVLDRVNGGWEGTDWFDLYKNENAIQHSHSLSVNGGSDRSAFNISLSYSNQEGILGAEMASNYERYGGRINSDHVLLRNDAGRDVIKLGENLTFYYQKSHDLAEGNGYYNIMQGAYKASPLVEAYDSEGNLTSWDKNGQGQYSTMIFQNPMTGLVNGEYSAINIHRNFGVDASMYLEIEPIKNLKWRGLMTTKFGGSTGRNFTKPFSESSTNANGNYSLNQSMSAWSSMLLNHTLSYVLPDLNGHHIDVMAGQEMQISLWSTGLGLSGKAGSDNVNSLVLKGFDYAMMNNFTADQLSGHSGYDYRHQTDIVSVFGRINYNYKEKYLMTLIARGDGSKNFSRGNRWGFFPSVSAGWVISNEKFMESTSSFMDFLKFRASWGQNGNCNVANFRYLSNVSFSPTAYADFTYNFLGGINNVVSNNYIQGAYLNNEPNNDLTWETSEQLDLGFDARFLDSRLGVNFDWYKKTTKDWLVLGLSDDVKGYETAAWTNDGKVENTGIEIALNWNDNIGKDFHYHATLNVATNKNRVKSLQQQLGTDQSSALFQNSSYISLVTPGHPVGYFYGMEYDGIWQTGEEITAARAAGQTVLPGAVAGDPKWIDYDGDGEINYDKDRHQIGDPNPNVNVGLVLGFDWKGIDFSVQGHGAFGMQVMKCYRTALLANQYENYDATALDRWHGAGTSNSKPRLTLGHTNDQWVSNRYMEDADYFKIQNVTLGYDLKKAFPKMPFQQLRLYVQAQNLYTFTDYSGVDPEIGSGGGKASWASGVDVGLYPSARTYIVGASIKF